MKTAELLKKRLPEYKKGGIYSVPDNFIYVHYSVLTNGFVICYIGSYWFCILINTCTCIQYRPILLMVYLVGGLLAVYLPHYLIGMVLPLIADVIMNGCVRSGRMTPVSGLSGRWC